MTLQAPAPQVEIGYAQATNYQWWLYENETTPELIWPQSTFVFDTMRRTDSQVTSVLRAMTLPVRRTPWRIDPNGAKPKVVQFVADDLGLPVVGERVHKPPPRSKDRFSWPDHLRQALLMLSYGHMYFEQVYRVEPDGSAAHLRKLGPRMPKTIERIDVAADGGLVGIKQYWSSTNNAQQTIPVNRLVAYIHEREGGNWLGTSILRPAYKNWLLKDRLLRVQAQTIERNGMGIPLYKAAEGATEMATGLAMAKAWRAGDAAGSAVPFGADLILRGVEGTLPDAEPAVRYHDEQIGRAVLAHFLNLGTQTGSWALGTTFADFFTLSLQTLADQVADTATQHIVEDLVDINFGEDEPAPRIVCDEIGSRQAATAEALRGLVMSGIIHPDEVLEESTRQQYGLPPKDPNAPKIPPPLPSMVRENLTGQAPGALPLHPGTAAAPAADAGATDASAAVAAMQGVAASAALELLGEEIDEQAETITAALDEWVEAQLPADIEAKFNPEELRIPGGKGGGRWTKNPIGKAISDALDAWGKGKGPDDPFTFDGKEIPREPLRKAAVDRGHTFKRGATREEIVKALLGGVRDEVVAARTERQKRRSGAKFSINGPDGRKIDVAVYTGADPNKPTLREITSANRPGRTITSQPDLAGLEKWANDNGHTDVAQWAASERARAEAKGAPKTHPTDTGGHITQEEAGRRMFGTGPAKKAAPAKKAPAKKAPGTRTHQTDTGGRISEADAAKVMFGDAPAKKAATKAAKAAPKAAPAPKLTAADRAQAAKVASAFHEDWRKTRLQSDGSFEPRVKTTTDHAWIAKHGTDQVDIANSTYADLPADWKAENKAAAEVVQGILKAHGGTVDLNDEKTRLAVGEQIHQAWLSRNEWAKGGELDVPFADLPRSEQDKDTDQLKVAMGALAPPSSEARLSAKELSDLTSMADLPRRYLAMVKPGTNQAANRRVDRLVRLGYMTRDPADGHLEVTDAGRKRAGVLSADEWQAQADAKKATPSAPHPDGLDSLEGPRLKSYAAEFLDSTTGMNDAQLRAALRAQGVGSPDVEQAKRIAEAAKVPEVPTSRAELSLDPVVRKVQIENRVRAAYTAVLDRTGRHGENWVGFADLRREIGSDVSRDELDRALIDMTYDGGQDPRGRRPVLIAPESNQKTLTQADRDAALFIGNQNRHLIRIDDPTPRPLPAGGARPKGEGGAAAPITVGRDISTKVDFATLPPVYDMATNTDTALREIRHQQGFDGLPTVVSQAEFDAAVKRGDVQETWRAEHSSPFSPITPDEMVEQYRTGDFYPGTGINGNGTYVALRQDQAHIYGSTLMRVGLRKDARTISADDLDAEMDRYFATAPEQTAQHRRREQDLLAALQRARSPRARANARRAYREDMYGPDLRSRTLQVQRDPGRFAALRGYDAITIPKDRSPDHHAEIIILNRTATIVQGA